MLHFHEPPLAVLGISMQDHSGTQNVGLKFIHLKQKPMKEKKPISGAVQVQPRAPGRCL